MHDRAVDDRKVVIANSGVQFTLLNRKQGGSASHSLISRNLDTFDKKY